MVLWAKIMILAWLLAALVLFILAMASFRDARKELAEERAFRLRAEILLEKCKALSKGMSEKGGVP